MEQQQKQQKLAFGDIHYKNVELFKLLTSLTLPVTYSDHFYFKILHYSEFSRIAYFNDVPVGSITCREETHNGKKYVYIMTFGVLEPYRRLGFGSQLLEEIIRSVRERPEIRAIYLHMWVKNETGFEFYKKHNFEVVRSIENYYQDIDPPHCKILRKKLYPDEDKDDDLIVESDKKTENKEENREQ